MKLTKEVLPEYTHNCANIHYKKCKFTVESPLIGTDLHGTGLEKFNTVVLPSGFETLADEIHNLEVYEDDTWVISYPRTGTNWVMETVWQICHEVDIEGKGKMHIRERFPLLEFSSYSGVPGDTSSIMSVKNQERPRFIWTHLPVVFLPKKLWTVKPKIVYVLRDPKDAAISSFHLFTHLFKYLGTKEEFLDMYLSGLFEYGSIWDHIDQYHTLQNHYSNIKPIQYETMKKDLKKIVLELCEYFGINLTEEKVQLLLKHLEFNSMKSNQALNWSEVNYVANLNFPGTDWNFLRKGQVGTHVEEMPEIFIDRFDKMTEEKLRIYQLYD